MNERLILIATGIALLSSCGSGTMEPGEEEPIETRPPEQIVPVRFVTPAPDPEPLPQQAQQSIFRTPDLTTELPEEKELLSRPVSAPAETPPTLNN